MTALPDRGPPADRRMTNLQYEKMSDSGLYVVVIIVITEALPVKKVAALRNCHTLIAVTRASKDCSIKQGAFRAICARFERHRVSRLRCHLP